MWVVICGAVGVLALAVFGMYLRFLYAPAPPEPPLDASVVSGRIAIDGRERTYTAVIPRDLPASAPLLFVFHGSNQGSEGIRVATGYGFDRLAEREGFVVVYPEGARSLMAAENLNFAKLGGLPKWSW